MSKTLRANVCLLALAAVLAVGAQAVNAAPEPAQGPCVATAGEKLQKFTGEISTANATLLEVRSGNQSVEVHYTVRVPVCEGGHLVPDAALRAGASVVVYGPITRQGSATEMTAMKIVVGATGAGDSAVTGSNLGEVRGTAPVANSGAAGTHGAAATDNWNSGTNQGADPASNSLNNSAPQGSSNQNGSQDSSGNPRGRGNPQNSGATSCTALLFSVTTREGITGQAGGRRSISGITCRMPVNQQAVQLTQDAMMGRHLAGVTLNWQNQLEATLTNAEISSVQFMSDNGTPVVDVTYSYQKGEMVHLASGMRVAF